MLQQFCISRITHLLLLGAAYNSPLKPHLAGCALQNKVATAAVAFLNLRSNRPPSISHCLREMHHCIIPCCIIHGTCIVAILPSGAPTCCSDTACRTITTEACFCCSTLGTMGSGGWTLGVGVAISTSQFKKKHAQ